MFFAESNEQPDSHHRVEFVFFSHHHPSMVVCNFDVWNNFFPSAPQRQMQQLSRRDLLWLSAFARQDIHVLSFTFIWWIVEIHWSTKTCVETNDWCFSCFLFEIFHNHKLACVESERTAAGRWCLTVVVRATSFFLSIWNLESVAIVILYQYFNEFICIL